jgi:RNA polymerase sigma-70 factor, ECF subfamily
MSRQPGWCHCYLWRRAILSRVLGIVVSRSLPVQLVVQHEPVLDDSALVHAFVAHEDWAPRAIWDRHAPMVYRLLKRALGSQLDAEDLTQEVFLRAFSKIPSLRDGNALRSFIYSIALRTLKWELRRRRVRRILRLTDTGRLPDVAADADERPNDIRIYYKLLDHVSVNARTAFVLRRLEGMQLQDVAVTLGVSTATAKRWVATATKQISRLVDDDVELSSSLGRLGESDADE